MSLVVKSMYVAGALEAAIAGDAPPDDQRKMSSDAVGLTISTSEFVSDALSDFVSDQIGKRIEKLAMFPSIGFARLPNIGFSCWLNVVLQSLFRTVGTHMFETLSSFKDSINEQKDSSHGRFLCCLSQLMQDYLNPTNGCVSQSKLHSFYEAFLALHSTDEAFMPQVFGQADASEAHCKMIESIEKCFNLVQDTIERKIIPDHLFKGEYKTVVICAKCDHTSESLEPFEHVDVEIKDHEVMKFSACFDSFGQSQDVPELECSGCKTKGHCSKHQTLWILPEVLVVVFKRYDNTGKKISNSVIFPVDQFHCPGPPQVKQHSYNLESVIEHHGQENQGKDVAHYISYSRHDSSVVGSMWVKYNDDDVGSIAGDPSAFFDYGNSYILYYRRQNHTNVITQDWFCPNCKKSWPGEFKVCPLCALPIDSSVTQPTKNWVSHSSRSMTDPSGIPLAGEKTEKKKVLTGMAKYKMTKKLGEGGFGKVYKAHLVDNKDEKVAIKRFKLRDRDYQTQASKEFEILKPLKHRHIIKCMDNFYHHRQFFVVFEYANAQDLRRFIHGQAFRREMFNAPDIANWFTQIVSGMSFLHYNKIMHRDIKPANIVICRPHGSSVYIKKRKKEPALLSRRDKKTELKAATPHAPVSISFLIASGPKPYVKSWSRLIFSSSIVFSSFVSPMRT
eukprot:gene93-252_t